MQIGASQIPWLPLTVALALAGTLTSQQAGPGPCRYTAAAYVSDGFGVNSRLVIFPSDRRQFSIPLPLALRSLTFGARGESLYAGTFKRLDAKTVTPMPGLFKIELNPARVNALPGSDGFYLSGRFAISRREDMLLFAGVRTDAGSMTCGIFEFNLPDGNLRSVLETSDCRAGSPWRVFDISPDASEALIRVDRRLALLDLAQGRVTPLEGELWGGAYSPDGKWIAALELFPPGRSRTILIDPKDLSRRRDLGGSNDDEVVWSPDSRFLLHVMPRDACPSQNPSALETLDIETGQRFTLKNSICKAGAGRDIGWVSSKITR
jgi:hypothetical protein